MSKRADRSGVAVTAATPEGLFRGVTTLRQLLPAKADAGTLQNGPCRGYDDLRLTAVRVLGHRRRPVAGPRTPSRGAGGPRSCCLRPTVRTWT
ncbi:MULTISPECIES: glycoside hydrolase family 20 zincin-like fold domain-containing protein [unclassified Kribbella]|uniref:glycoside hydrolase family 20 zincin-like fold domain-containing protein n=1 Tax=unclassified Kribbella TaxID=2644121 RepID=UPI00341048E6